ncbi:MAG: 4'-phosphopantetheinyl transferase superfamily protein [Symploca sp. SIO2E6]|nr:4'-phosphopantetheinyl transferase superfamily protein [Symploca sp. SIO2E6]
MKTFKDLWQPPPQNLVLSEEDVHIWRAKLDLPVVQIQQLAQTLSTDEQQRADKFYFEKDKKHFIAGRGFLRVILARYLDLEPAQLKFAYSSRGKPTLANITPGGTVDFNLSHSRGMALYAVTRNRQIGIDLEYIRSVSDVDQLAKRFFSPRESAVISSLSPEQKQEEFFKAWTGKEAYLKATGDGLAGLEEVEIFLNPGKPAALLNIQGDQQAASNWCLYPLAVAPGYLAAVAVKGHDWYLRMLDMS